MLHMTKKGLSPSDVSFWRYAGKSGHFLFAEVRVVKQKRIPRNLSRSPRSKNIYYFTEISRSGDRFLFATGKLLSWEVPKKSHLRIRKFDFLSSLRYRAAKFSILNFDIFRFESDRTVSARFGNFYQSSTTLPTSISISFKKSIATPADGRLCLPIRQNVYG